MHFQKDIPEVTFTPLTGLLILTSPDTSYYRKAIHKMKPRTAIAKTPGETLLPLVKEIRDLVQSARRAASQSINTLQVATSFEIGRRIVEYEQQGSKRAEYGERILIELSNRLTEELGRGFSATNLEYMRRFYLDYHETAPQIPQTVSGKLPAKTQMETPIVQAPPAQLPAKTPVETPIGQTLSAQFTPRVHPHVISNQFSLLSIDSRQTGFSEPVSVLSFLPEYPAIVPQAVGQKKGIMVAGLLR